MKTKHTLMLLILVLVFGFTNAPGIGKSQEERILESNLIFGNDSDINCKLQTKSSTVRQTSGGNLTVSINSNWICR